MNNIKTSMIISFMICTKNLKILFLLTYKFIIPQSIILIFFILKKNNVNYKIVYIMKLDFCNKKVAFILIINLFIKKHI